MLSPTGRRPAARSCCGMVTAPHALASQVGVTLLQQGGNAADAVIGVAASLAVLYPHMTGIGGDAFFLYYDEASGRTYAYNGSGAAAQLATLEYYGDRKFASIPERGGAAALTVPGAVDSWFALHERFGSMEMEQVLGPAIAYARDGAPAARSFVEAVVRLGDVLSADEGATQLYIERGPRNVGDVFTNPALGDALQSIARFGRGWFYEGEGARAIEQHCERLASPLRAGDFASHQGHFSEPIDAKVFGFDSLTTPPNSQGVALLEAQQIYEAYAAGNRLECSEAAGVHAGVEAIRLAFADRDAHVGDPDGAAVWHRLLTFEHATSQAQKISPYQVLGEQPQRVDGGDTTYFACVDQHGNAVSFIQSLFFGFGAAVVIPKLGIALQNRGISFELEPGRLRSLVPAKRPFHTLMPCMLAREGKPWLIYGSMGGEGQPQTALQLSTRIARDREDPQAAIEAPRWRWGKTAGDEPALLHVEARLGASCIAGLRARGHDVNVLNDWDESMGHAGAIIIDHDNGTLTGGADPRGDGCALGF